jgi:hypothetical protein
VIKKGGKGLKYRMCDALTDNCLVMLMDINHVRLRVAINKGARVAKRNLTSKGILSCSYVGEGPSSKSAW